MPCIFFLKLIFPHYKLVLYTFFFAEIEVRDSKDKCPNIIQLYPEDQFREVDETFAVLSKGD